MIMKTKAILLGTAALMFTLTSEKAIAQIGTPYIHDPSTIMECDGKYYTFGTGGGGLISEDGWTWNGGGVRPGGGAAPATWLLTVPREEASAEDTAAKY